VVRLWYEDGTTVVCVECWILAFIVLLSKVRQNNANQSKGKHLKPNPKIACSNYYFCIENEFIAKLAIDSLQLDLFDFI
jgi:hypothetical protein